MRDSIVVFPWCVFMVHNEEVYFHIYAIHSYINLGLYFFPLRDIFFFALTIMS